ncbi:hypothetical protein C8D77_101213 [Mesorhizobium loti]|uniref:Uncharacterized protein n=1 Tax=Rhizobium loti TaxID=381 RepID=A0A8E2WIF5_RHILI|nr:hypothetical protein [Mesorhizobium loti]PWJ93534.1 hypothetical protein C8D77_101213 [Mesorhizobium loti]
MLTVACVFWDANEASFEFSRCYTEEWVERLHRGFTRNLTVPFRFVCFTERQREFSAGIEQELTGERIPDYGTLIDPYLLGEPMILVGLDTVVTGNCDAMAEYALTSDTIALPRDPYAPHRACTGVQLVPAGNDGVWWSYQGGDDMEHMRKQPHVFIDDVFPGQAESYKGCVRDHGLGATRIVYFHGRPKMDELDEPWISEHWR